MALEQDVQKAVDALVVRLRDTIESDIRGLVHELVTRSDAERQRLVDEARKAAETERTAAVAAAKAEAQEKADAERAAAEKITADVRQQVQGEMASQISDARAASSRGEQAALAAVSRILDSVRRLDEQVSLTAILDTLTELIAAEVGRVAVFVQTNGEMRGWRFAGFGPEVGDARARVLNGSDAGFLSAAIGERRSRILTANAAVREAADRPPAFAALPADRNALAVPVLVGGEATVLVYADDMSADRPSVLSHWSDAVELLARHAGHRLESITAERAASLARGVTPVALGAPVERAPDAPAAESEDEEAARRYARLLVSEIKLYNETAVNEGRTERDLGFRLKNEIDRARSLYEERIPDTVRSRELLFEQELIRTLADGDPSLLGT